MQVTNSISFGFYNGLGDFISELPLIEWFYKNGYEVEIFVYSWLHELAKYMAPFAKVKSINSTKSIFTIRPNSEYFFLSPGYVHKFSYSMTSPLSYIIKKIILTIKVKKLISSTFNDIYNYTFNLKKNYLDGHFFYSSLNLLKQNFDMPYLEEPKSENQNFKKLFIFPFSGNDKKDYPLENFAQIAENFSKRYTVTILVPKKDRNRVTSILKNFIIMTISLKQISQILDDKTIVLANDSGPAHLAAYRGCGVVALYGITNSHKYKPNGRGRVISLQGNGKRVSTIPIEKVIDAINSL